MRAPQAPAGPHTRKPAGPGLRERLVAAVLFVTTAFTVFMVYGTQWMGGDPLSEPAVAQGSLKYAVALMGILQGLGMDMTLITRVLMQSKSFLHELIAMARAS